MFSIVKIGLAVTMAVALSGCFSDSGNSGQGPNLTLDFTTFVKAQVKATSNTGAPESLDRINFSFNDQNNPQAYDDLLR
ncbi:hypothetical protein QQF73_12860 [Marinobacter sp. M216]|uniref:Uncharacterized protein n=1 Tax=Marinobacter albus TaxID=3030833 RepID=A0ABT7HG62_9GAMM|nr:MULTISPECIES: hypothetical protein [unclassified Marinobacter]MBW7471946.1 hypothetical protein [Marinobacter sp. F4218]MDK9558516.1 hypothetical protein [Marinobacter sp. M216]